MSLHDVDAEAQPPTDGLRWLPRTRTARWGLGLGVAGLLLMPTWMLMGPLGAFPQLLLMAVGGGTCVFAIWRRGERAVLAFAGAAPLLLVVAFAVGELAAPH